jgi:hypothetical protein
LRLEAGETRQVAFEFGEEKTEGTKGEEEREKSAGSGRSGVAEGAERVEKRGGTAGNGDVGVELLGGDEQESGETGDPLLPME